MKYLIISDIHGSSYYLKLVLEKHPDYDKLILLGDILYHGPRNPLPEGYNPLEVMEILNKLKDKIVCVRGNCDAKVDLEVLDFEIKDLIWINLNGKKFCLTHGDVYNNKHLPTKFKNYYLLYGHWHKNIVTKINDKIVAINIGSLSLPKDNHHSYALLDDNKLVNYDLLTEEVICSVELD